MTASHHELKSEDAAESQLNGEKETRDEVDENQKDEKNGAKTRFMFNIADGGFTGEDQACVRSGLGITRVLLRVKGRVMRMFLGFVCDRAAHIVAERRTCRCVIREDV